MRNKKFTGSVSGKGYYIALVLCAAAIGIAGFLYYRNADTPDPSLENPTVGAPGNDQQVVATDPGGAVIGDISASQPPEGETVLKTVSPLQGQTVAVYAMDSLVYNETTRDWRVHNGVDIAAEAGAEVGAAADGEVYTVYEDEMMGMTVVIRHAGGYTTKYSSLSKEVSVKAGEKVTAGQVIGTVDNTALMESAIGDHLHFSVTLDGKAYDPAEFLNQ